MSRALGFVGVARRASPVYYSRPPQEVERIPYRPVHETGSQQPSPRGPCPRNLQKLPSLPSILLEADRKAERYE